MNLAPAPSYSEDFFIEALQDEILKENPSLNPSKNPSSGIIIGLEDPVL